MQGTVCVPKNPHQGTPPPQTRALMNMDEFKEIETEKSSKSQQNDSGFFSTTANSTNCDSDNRSDCSSPERKYICPICDMTLTASHDFTLHIRSHNNDSEEQNNENGFICKICHKMLSSSSSLDRHVLVHSGERPFHCKFCGDTFTTNGNMHRHMRTHSLKTDSYESDGSTGSGSNKSTEFNNNKVDEELNNNKRKLDLDDPPSKRQKSIENNDPQNFKCLVCERDDFTSVSNLNSHMKDNHPEYPATCSICKQVFINNKLLSIHENLSHGMITPKNPVPGFKDLTFVDFSSNKFPVIAQYECETNLHTVSNGLKFQCNICSRAFPCSSSLDIHTKNCMDKNSEIYSTKLKQVSEDELRRRDFFSRLNLQNSHIEEDESPPHSPVDTPHKLKQHLVKAMDNTKDLADIQSILSNINLQRMQNKHNETKEDTEGSINEIDLNKNEGEEEAQDSFAIEFRKMKLRGEFPCRLCTAVFPNLRALKGHNRAHLNGNSSGTYFCNMCPHSSIDKAALIRHMRSHNGDRPYECSICNYAFTTKANCERHLRNRHSKTTREEVKKSIIYHPSEDPTNEDLNKLNLKLDHKNSSFNSSTDKEMSPVKIHCSTPKTHNNQKSDMTTLKPTGIPPILDLQKLQPTGFQNMDFLRNVNIRQFREHNVYQSPIPNNLPQSIEIFPTKYSNNNLSAENSIPPRLPTKMFVGERREYYDDNSEDVALDLSTKKVEPSEDETPEDLSRKKSDHSPENKFPSNITEILHQQLLNSQPKIDPAAIYATQLAQIYRNGFPAWPGFPVNSLLFSALPGNLAQNQHEIIKERMQRFQLYGGSLISEEFKSTTHQTRGPLNLEPLKIRTDLTTDVITDNKSKDFTNTKELTPTSLTSEIENSTKVNSPVPSLTNSDIMHSPNSVKMVIKNGVLMPKQKQRRYRTERPFTCEHCSAKFTLRSNMERHIKQQHPQYWSQRHRNNSVSCTSNTKKVIGMQLKPYELSVPNFEMSKLYDFAESKEHINEKLKYAILAQKLKMSTKEKDEIKKEEDEDCALVIDENEEKLQDLNIRDFKENSSVTSEKSYENIKHEEDLVPVSRLLDNASQQQFKQFFKRDPEESEIGGVSEEDEEGLVAAGSTSEENISGTDENRSESDAAVPLAPVKKQSAYSLAPNRVSCPYCSRKFPWTSSLRRHILTHTGQKPFKCSHCPLLFTTKSNCDRHLLRKHGNSATTICSSDSTANGSLNHLLRNVPERPFKCSLCPSSTFSTYSNLKKHISEKHSISAHSDELKAQGYEASSSEDEKVNQPEIKNERSHSASFPKFIVRTEIESGSTNNQVINSDLPFKCHLCEGSFGERHEALEHIRDKHASEYDLLMSKNALEANATVPDDPTHNDDDEDIRGKFPDYSNRKVICAWCMRRFWSAEDLRRHMRTHTGERPFSCDICRRRFTLKHSMLRHRKKHNLNQTDNDTTISDEDGNIPTTEKLLEENNFERNNEKTDESDGNEGDLISNLLGIRDRSIIDRVLDASADDAAKLLGVKNNAK